MLLWVYEHRSSPHPRSSPPPYPTCLARPVLRKPDEDLFESTKMSFGQHLDELRSALIKAVLALAVGVAAGFTVSNNVVRYIQAPLQKGLIEFRQTQAEEKFVAHLKEREAAGHPVPEHQVDAARAFFEQGLVPRDWQVDPAELARMLSASGIEVVRTEDSKNQPQTPVPITLYMPAEDDPRTTTIGTGIPDAFMVWVKAALLVGAVAASPFIFYYLWAFVATGLYSHERKYVYIFMPFSLGLFLTGAAVAFFLAMGYVLKTLFLFYGWLEIDPTPRIGEWMNFALLLPLGFGLGFQLPLVMLFLERIGVFTVENYKNSWRMGVLIIAIASMVLTPSDWQSMVLLAVPMTGLYFGGILLCRFMPRRTTPFGDPLSPA